ncbi:MAG: HAD family phosphatase [Defluviitaleaceae bacterium]|nr:HAD family phosphatase [Defluviitaleaceae bacterium]
MKNHKAIAFDMDGVLIDSQPLHYEIDMAVLKKCNYSATLDTVTPYTGISTPDRWPRYKESLGLAQSVDELIALSNYYMTEIFNNTNLMPTDGIVDLLRFLREKNIPTAIASSSSHELIDMVLEKIKTRQYFTHFISGEDFKKGKPAPDIYLAAAKSFGLPPEECIAVEDSLIGILAAKNAGFTCIAYVNPSTHGQDFTHANHVITHFHQVKELIVC